MVGRRDEHGKIVSINDQALTRYLAELGKQVHTKRDDGSFVTREEALAEVLWRMALGWSERVRDNTGAWAEVYHAPVSWAIQLLWDRRDGKPAQAQPEEATRIKATDKVRELARSRINQLVSDPPPVYNPDV